MLREALAPLGVPLLGALARDPAVATPSRHLGLVPAAERAADARRGLTTLGAWLAAGVDLDGLLAVAASAPPLDAAPWSPPGVAAGARVPVAVAQGPAFTFVYEENLELLAAAGAELAPFDPAADERLPEGTAALYLGGGFPEVHGEALGANRALIAEVTAFAASGRPVVAECGGLLYLCRRLDGRPMCGALAADADMGKRLVLGYREASAATGSAAWPAGSAVRGHEFHHARVTPAAGPTPAWDIGGRGPEGFVSGGVHASFLHTHWAATPGAAGRLVAAADRARAALGVWAPLAGAEVAR
jgi:cobyrinic acid a,c-diamide synthase